MDDASVWYFAYGSNADPERFRGRVGEWRSRSAAWLADHRLRFASSVRSEGGGGAVVDPAPGERVDGVLYEIGAQQMAAMDREEFDPARDLEARGRRWSVSVQTAAGARDAELYNVVDEGGWCAPSARYLDHILRGLTAAGHGEEALERARRAARAAD